MVVIGGMHHMLGPALGVLFYILFRELFSIWTGNWLLWFGLVFVGFVLYSPEGLAGIWAKLRRRWNPPPEESAAMSRRKIYEGLPLPGFLCVHGKRREQFWKSRPCTSISAASARSTGASLTVRAGEIHALIGPNGAGKTTLFNLATGMFPPDAGAVRLHGGEIQRLPPHRICRQGLARSFQITNLFKGLSIYENLRLSLQARHPARFNAWRDIDSYPEIHAETARADEVPRPGRHRGDRRRRRSPTAGSGWWTWASRSAPSRACCCWTNRWRASPPPSASACRAW